MNFTEFNSINDLVDTILDKISASGFDSLTANEKDILNKFSKSEEIELSSYKEKPIKYRDANSPTSPRPSRKILEVGDTVVPVYKEQGELPDYAWEYLNSKDEFEVLKVNSKGKIDVGCHRLVGNKRKVFYYSTVRFEKLSNEDVTPFNEEDWEEEPETKKEKGPGDYYFYVAPPENDGLLAVAITSVEYFDREGFLDDNLGSYNLPPVVRQALNNAGVYGDSELMEAYFEVNHPESKTVQEVRQAMIEQGFVDDPEFINFLGGYDDEV
jgi:hypothetical protein